MQHWHSYAIGYRIYQGPCIASRRSGSHEPACGFALAHRCLPSYGRLAWEPIGTRWARSQALDDCWTIVLMGRQHKGGGPWAAPLVAFILKLRSLPLPGGTCYQLPVVQPLVVETGVQVRLISPAEFLVIVKVVPLVDFAVTA